MQSPRVIGFVLLVVLAGCGGVFGVDEPTVSETPTVRTETGAATTVATEPTDGGATATDATEPTDTGTTASESPPPRGEASNPRELAATYDVSVYNGVLPVNYSLVHARTVTLLDRERVAPAERVSVLPAEEMPTFDRRFSEFERALGLGVSSERDATLTASAFVPSSDRIVVNRQIFDENRTASVLAHESVHVVQLTAGTDDRLQSRLLNGSGPTTEQRQTYRAVIEGTATWTQRVYWERYRPDGTDPITRLADRFDSATVGQRLSLAPYYYGQRYVAQRVDDPSRLRSVYRNPPRSTEEILHGLPPGSEPVADLSVRDRAGDDWRVTVRETRGELFLRVAFTSALDRAAAARAADGWGADTQLTLAATDGDGIGHVWVHRWDDTANATEFVRLTTRFLNRTADERLRTDRGVVWRTDEASYRLVRVSDRTTALVLGDPAFVRNATVGGNGTAVTVTADSATERVSPRQPVVRSPGGLERGTSVTRAPIARHTSHAPATRHATRAPATHHDTHAPTRRYASPTTTARQVNHATPRTTRRHVSQATV